MKVNIIGGGIIGLFTAWYLQKDGHEVHVFDKGDLSDGCSYGNAGMITPSHFIPLASPGVVAQGIRWMFRSSSPFYIRPRLNGDLLHWLWLFYRACNRRQAAAAMPVLLDFNLWSKRLYEDFAKEIQQDFCLETKGILMLYQSHKVEKEEAETAHLANKLGLKAKVLNAHDIQVMEPEIAVKCLGGVFFPEDAHLHPNLLMQQLKALLRQKGVRFHLNTVVNGFITGSQKVTALQSNGTTHPADAFVLAGGSWAGMLAKKLRVNVPIQDGKGYSFTLPHPARRPRNATIFLEARVAVTPMGDDLRFGGTLEMSGHNSRINDNRVRGILEAIPRYYPDLGVPAPKPPDIWYGYRPCSPDGLPFIGRITPYNNVVMASGHAMMGVSLAPATGSLVSDILAERQAEGASLLPALNPMRYA
jgi:D-amino-acid dehydrogenase